MRAFLIGAFVAYVFVSFTMFLVGLEHEGRNPLTKWESLFFAVMWPILLAALLAGKVATWVLDSTVDFNKVDSAAQQIPEGKDG